MEQVFFTCNTLVVAILIALIVYWIDILEMLHSDRVIPIRIK